MGIVFGREFLFIILVPVWVIARVTISFLKLKNKKAFSVTGENTIGVCVVFVYIIPS